jgi:hexosaminidase
MKSFLFFVVLIISALVGFGQPVSIIPQPVSVKQAGGKFIITAKTVIVTKDAEEEKAADFFNAYLQSVYGFKLEKGSSTKKNYIQLNTKKFIQKPSSDAYTLMVTSSGVTITGDTYAGTFYGIQSLIQLLPVTKSAILNIPAVTITDAPRFNYRGMMLDVGRHFFPLPVVKKFIDYIALHKMNYFHWHLTDDQGWRIEIKKYPRLTEIGSTRNNTIIGHYPGTGNDNTPHGGFYTQDEIREVVQYAADRFITVVPEIEMPGHAEAALTAYNWLGCPGTGPYKVEGTWGVFNNVFCAGKDSTFQFLQDVIDEVLELFPSPYIHVGGDECPKTNWKKCPLCQARIKAEGLKDEHGLQSYFVHRMEKYINSKGRKIIGWDEILEGGLAPNATVMSWRGEEGGIDAAKQNHDVVMTPGGWVYFDHAQVEKDDSLTIGGFLPLGKVYGYEPIPKELNAEQAKHVLGGQANLWTEYITNLPKIEYMIFPRMSALSEVLWSPKNQRNWKLFLPRLQRQYKRYDLWKTNYSKAVLAEPATAANKNLNKKK